MRDARRRVEAGFVLRSMTRVDGEAISTATTTSSACRVEPASAAAAASTTTRSGISRPSGTRTLTAGSASKGASVAVRAEAGSAPRRVAARWCGTSGWGVNSRDPPTSSMRRWVSSGRASRSSTVHGPGWAGSAGCVGSVSAREAAVFVGGGGGEEEAGGDGEQDGGGGVAVVGVGGSAAVRARGRRPRGGVEGGGAGRAWWW
ncbi:hypothetical protein TR51_23790 [Kitasatospora griseola]|uniref:Uncharacterized protein n=1 Tax=Kitasatospora griseola TaxID=2064 RepID=A0A0D0PI77_KITGR|nr:hypothetical protein TR51_23790 [Kitasatospora griseola]